MQFDRVVPTFRIFSLEKAHEFYIDFLGFKIDWEHRFEDGAPVYMQVSRDGLIIHLSEHHGDGSPGAVVYVYMRGIADLHRELNGKAYRHNRPGLERMEWSMTEMTVTDPFGNRIRFGEISKKSAA